jgi:DNA-binding transcriptional LysR family regulator
MAAVDAQRACAERYDLEQAAGHHHVLAMMPALIAGTGLGILPEFILRGALGANQLERLLPDWSLPLRTVYWVTPSGEPQPKRVEVLADFLMKKLAAYGEGGTRINLS